MTARFGPLGENDKTRVALPKGYRLKRRQEFEQVYRRGRRYPSPHLLLRLLRSPSHPLDPSRIAVVVSLKVSKRAVTRNLLRRRIQAALTSLLAQLAPGYWVVITVKPGTAECAYCDILRELEQLLIKAEVLHGY